MMLGLGGYAKIQTSRLESCKQGFEAFKATVKAQGELAATAAKKANLDHQKAMEDANAKSTKLLADNASLGKRLRLARASSGYVPPAPANSPSPDRACFDRAELERAIGDLDAGLQGIVGQGDAFALKLSTAQEWAKAVGQVRNAESHR